MNDARYVINDNPIVRSTIVRNFERSIFHLLFGLITSNLMVPFWNSDATMEPDIITTIKLRNWFHKLLYSSSNK